MRALLHTSHRPWWWRRPFTLPPNGVLASSGRQWFRPGHRAGRFAAGIGPKKRGGVAVNFMSAATHVPNTVIYSGGTVPGSSGSITIGSVTTGSGSSFTSVSQTSSLLSIAGIAVEVLALLGFMVIVGLFIIIVVANRADPDPSGRRPQSVYYFAVSFVALVTAIVGSLVVVVSLIQLIGHHSSGVGDTTARAVVLGG